MLTHTEKSLLHRGTHSKVIPILESRLQLAQMLEQSRGRALLLRHCNLFELGPLLNKAQQRGYSIYVNIDHIDGINADAAGLHYLAEHLHIIGIISHHPKILAQGKEVGLETIQRIFAVDSTGLETALESVDTHSVDILDISPALVIPYIGASLPTALPLPFIGSGLITTQEQIQAILHSGALSVTVWRPELWS